LASIIPSWKLLDPIATSESTITDLMTHRTGLPRHDFAFIHGDVECSVECLPYLKPSATFRWTFQYNSIMYAILAYLPTILLPNKPSFVRYVTDHIIDSLG
ncbi:hypothetical protein B0H14DRAFT_2188756, partial [Mycena olivaceomarginata]